MAWVQKNVGLTGDALFVRDVWPVPLSMMQGKANLDVWLATKGGLYLSRNGCESWNPVTLPIGGSAYPVAVRTSWTSHTMYVLIVVPVVGFPDQAWLAATSDYGTSWTTLDLDADVADFRFGTTSQYMSAKRLGISAEGTYIYVSGRRGVNPDRDGSVLRIPASLAAATEVYSEVNNTCDIRVKCCHENDAILYLFGNSEGNGVPGDENVPLLEKSIDSGASFSDIADPSWASLQLGGAIVTDLEPILQVPTRLIAMLHVETQAGLYTYLSLDGGSIWTQQYSELGGMDPGAIASSLVTSRKLLGAGFVFEYDMFLSMDWGQSYDEIETGITNQVWQIRPARYS